jgi:hypothetical protein
MQSKTFGLVALTKPVQNCNETTGYACDKECNQVAFHPSNNPPMAISLISPPPIPSGNQSEDVKRYADDEKPDQMITLKATGLSDKQDG